MYNIIVKAHRIDGPDFIFFVSTIGRKYWNIYLEKENKIGHAKLNLMFIQTELNYHFGVFRLIVSTARMQPLDKNCLEHLSRHK